MKDLRFRDVILTCLVGMHYQVRNKVRREWLMENLGLDSPLTIKREPKNAADPNACAVFVNGGKIGYLPRETAAKLAPKLDRGSKYQFYVLVAPIPGIDPHIGIIGIGPLSKDFNRKREKQSIYGGWRLRLYPRKDSSVRVKCGCCDKSVEVYYGTDPFVEINGVCASRQEWIKFLGPVLFRGR